MTESLSMHTSIIDQPEEPSDFSSWLSYCVLWHALLSSMTLISQFLEVLAQDSSQLYSLQFCLSFAKRSGLDQGYSPSQKDNLYQGVQQLQWKFSVEGQGLDCSPKLGHFEGLFGTGLTW